MGRARHSTGLRSRSSGRRQHGRGALCAAVIYLLGSGAATGADDLGATMPIGAATARDAGGPASQPARATLPSGEPAAATADGGNPAVEDAAHGPRDGEPASQPARREGPAWAPKLRATVKPATAQVGDPIEVQIVVAHRQDVSLTLPLALELGDFGELSREASRKVEGPQGHMPTVTQTYRLRVAAYKLGELTLPPIELTALGPGDDLMTVATTAFPIKIVSVMANEPDPKLAQAEPPVRVYRRTWWLLYTLGALAALGLVVLTTVLVHRRVQARRRASAPPPPPIPPHVLALERLDQLELEALLAQEQYQQLYLELSEILREYIGRLWGFDALEMTSAEIGAALARQNVPGELRQRLQQTFGEWDLVKFAKYRPDAQAARGAAADTRAFVDQTAATAPSRPQDSSAAAPETQPAEQGERSA